MNATVNADQKKNSIMVSLRHSLDVTDYYVPLTLKTYVPKEWKNVVLKNGESREKLTMKKDNNGSYVLYKLPPNKGIIEITHQ
jgi:hypothetical protein